MSSEKPSFAIFGGEGGHPDYKRNMNKAMMKGVPVGSDMCCVYCGKPSGFGPSAVFLDSMGRESDPSIPENWNDCLGFYPMGSSCAKLARDAGWKVYPRNKEKTGYIYKSK